MMTSLPVLERSVWRHFRFWNIPYDVTSGSGMFHWWVIKHAITCLYMFGMTHPYLKHCSRHVQTCLSPPPIFVVADCYISGAHRDWELILVSTTAHETSLGTASGSALASCFLVKDLKKSIGKWNAFRSISEWWRQTSVAFSLREIIPLVERRWWWQTSVAFSFERSFLFKRGMTSPLVHSTDSWVIFPLNRMVATIASCFLFTRDCSVD